MKIIIISNLQKPIFFRNLGIIGPFILLLAIAMVLPSCKKEAIDPCAHQEDQTLQSIEIGAYPDHYWNRLTLDLEHDLCVITKNAIHYFPKTETGTPFVLKNINVDHVVVNEQDTIVLIDNKFIRLFPSTRQMEMIFSVNQGVSFEFSVTPGHGIGYTNTIMFTDYFNYFDFETRTNRTLFKVGDILANIAHSIRNFHTYIRNDSVHLLVSADNIDIPFNHHIIVYDVNLQNNKIRLRNDLENMKSFRIEKMHDNENLMIISSSNSDKPFQVANYNLESNTFYSSYRTQANWFKTKHYINGDYLCYSLWDDNHQNSDVYLIHWPTGNEILQVKTTHNVHGVHSRNIGEDYLVTFTEKLNIALVYDKGGCPLYKLASSSNFNDVLSATHDYIITINEDGVVEKFDLP